MDVAGGVIIVAVGGARTNVAFSADGCHDGDAPCFMCARVYIIGIVVPHDCNARLFCAIAALGLGAESTLLVLLPTRTEPMRAGIQTQH